MKGILSEGELVEIVNCIRRGMLDRVEKIINGKSFFFNNSNTKFTSKKKVIFFSLKFF
jgi:hypothetical protein